MTYVHQITLAELDILARILTKHLVPNTVLLLQGNLGAGKTTFVQSLGRSLGIKESITSPSFTLIDEYWSGRMPLYHSDLYRLEPAAAKELHLELYWQGEFTPGIVAIEWAERLLVLPDQFIQINFAYAIREDERQLTWKAEGENAKLILDNFWQDLSSQIIQAE